MIYVAAPNVAEIPQINEKKCSNNDTQQETTITTNLTNRQQTEEMPETQSH